jgi:single stranded DNA-binding protein
LQEETEFHNVVAWGKLGEIVSQILKRGNKAFVEGRLRTHAWEGQDGIKRQRTEVIMENFIPLTPKGIKEVEEIAEAVPVTSEMAPEAEVEGKKEKKTSKPTKADSEENEEIDLDEIPF